MNDLKSFLEKFLELEDPWLINDITFDQSRPGSTSISISGKAGPSP